MKEGVATSLNFSGTRGVVGLAFDPVTQRVYWTSIEPGKQGIRYAHLHGNGGRRAEFLVRSEDGQMSNPEGLALDHVGRNLYFTNMVEDHSNSYVGVVDLASGRWMKLITRDVQKPRGIAVYPERGLLFYADWGSSPALVRANMDGTGVERIVWRDVRWINGVAVDRSLDRIYWTDANHDRIESAELDGSDRRLILEGVAHPVFISVFEDSVYWSDWIARKVFACNKFTGRNVTVLYKEPDEYPTGLTLYHPLVYPTKDEPPCLFARCSHFCLLRPEGAVTCACPPTYVLDRDRATCTCPHGAAPNNDGTACVVVSQERELPDARAMGEVGEARESADTIGGSSNEVATTAAADQKDVKSSSKQASTVPTTTTTTTTTTSTGGTEESNVETTTTKVV